MWNVPFVWSNTRRIYSRLTLLGSVLMDLYTRKHSLQVYNMLLLQYSELLILNVKPLKY